METDDNSMVTLVVRNESLTLVCLPKDHVLGQLQVATISSRDSDYYVGMTQVQNGVLYIGYRGACTLTSEKQGKKPIDQKHFTIQVQQYS